MPENILFYIIFLSQIFLISYFYPRKILRRMKYVLATYPADTYPRLYPKPVVYYENGQRNFRLINYVIFALGILTISLSVILDSAFSGKISEAVPTAYFFIQMIPFMILEFSEFAYFKTMRKADRRTTRHAELLPRRLVDFIPAKFVGLAVLMFLACIGFFYNLEQFRFHPDNDTFVILVTLGLSNFLFAGIIYWNLYGKKLNPHQSNKDRFQQIEVTVKSLIFMSITASIFLIVMKAVDTMQLDLLKPALMSIYFQFIIVIGLGSLLRKLRIENLDFDVYKADTLTKGD